MKHSKSIKPQNKFVRLITAPFNRIKVRKARQELQRLESLLETLEHRYNSLGVVSDRVYYKTKREYLLRINEQREILGLNLIKPQEKQTITRKRKQESSKKIKAIKPVDSEDFRSKRKLPRIMQEGFIPKTQIEKALVTLIEVKEKEPRKDLSNLRMHNFIKTNLETLKPLVESLNDSYLLKQFTSMMRVFERQNYISFAKFRENFFKELEQKEEMNKTIKFKAESIKNLLS